MTKMFHEHLLNELHMVTYQPGDPARLCDQRLCEAVTVNENLRSLGYTLRPADLLLLAVSPSLPSFYEDVKALLPDVKARPMYPGFPQQVMSISEAEFRFHQALHYFTTYGIEELTGNQVQKGWLPGYGGPKGGKADTRLLDAKVLQLVSQEEAPLSVLKILFERRERLTYPEMDLVLESTSVCSAEQMQGLTVRFKENLELLFPLVMEKADRATALKTLRILCAHTGDVFRCSERYLRRRKYHLRTSEKKLLVKLLESYPVGNLRQNLIQSNRLRERNLMVLQHLDYNQYSRSPEHGEAVRALRNGELLSWHGIGESLIAEHSPRALTHLAQRPGYMLRMLNRLLSLDYAQEAISEALVPHAERISGHLVLKVLRTLANRRAATAARYAENIEKCNAQYQQEAYACSPEGLKEQYDWRKRTLPSLVENRKEWALKQFLTRPRREAERTAKKMTTELSKRVRLEEEKLETLRLAVEKQRALENGGKAYAFSNGSTALDTDLIWCRVDPNYFPDALARCEAEVAPLREQLEKAQAEADAWFQKTLNTIAEINQPLYEQELQAIDLWGQEEQKRIEEVYRKGLENVPEATRAVAERKAAELAALEADYQRQLHEIRFDFQTVEILKALLKAHFRTAVTPLGGKKVYLDFQQFDLAHSSLETEDRSKDGGYTRSGIAWKIPDNARYVRFFVYWNDPERVDIDLHAGGVDMEGNSFHVGWDGDFRKCGVLHSGDVTHSDSVEYIDIDMNAPIREIYANVNLFFGNIFVGKFSFRDVETCYVGMIAVKEIGQEIKHYNPANCFFTHKMTQDARNLFYGYIDVPNRCVRFVGQPNYNCWAPRSAIEDAESMFSLQDYLDCVLEGQQVETVKTMGEADVVLTMGKSIRSNGVSLIDSNFFLEC